MIEENYPPLFPIKNNRKIEVNRVYLGDCLEILKKIPNEFVDLIYIDPPFFTQNKFKDFNDKWDSLKEYLNFMRKIIRECYRVLKNTGSFWLHCDWHASHYLKIECDKIFKKENFQNEIIWHYSGTGRPKKKFKAKHDNIFYYVKNKKNKKNTFNLLTKSITNIRTLKRYNKFDKDGKQFKYFQGKKVYLQEMPLDDVWDINIIGATSKERTGYRTQKPETLLEQIILASSDEKSVILDPMCGSGTTLKVAEKLNRYYIGCDINPKAVEIAKKRLAELDK